MGVKVWAHGRLALLLRGPMPRAPLALTDRIRGMDAALQLRPDLSVTAVAAMLRPIHSDFKDRFLDALRKVGLPE